MLRKFLRQLEMTRSNLLHWHLQNKAYFYFWCYWSAKAATWVTISNMALRKWTQKIARESRTKAMGKAQQQEYNQLLYYVYIYIFRCCCSIMGLKTNQSWGFQLMLDEFGGFKCASLSILLGCRNCQGRAGRGGTDPSEDCGRPSRLEMVPGMGQALTGKMLILDDKSYAWGQMLQGYAYTCIIVYILLLELCICRYVWYVMMFFSAIWFLLHPFYSFPPVHP